MPPGSAGLEDALPQDGGRYRPKAANHAAGQGVAVQSGHGSGRLGIPAWGIIAFEVAVEYSRNPKVQNGLRRRSPAQPRRRVSEAAVGSICIATRSLEAYTSVHASPVWTRCVVWPGRRAEWLVSPVAEALASSHA
jgi:hypothetical protein